MTANPLLQIKEKGQAVWLDNLSRPLITSGELARLIREDGISGITSNPVIFEKAMNGSDAYDAQLGTLATAGRSTTEIYESLAIQDIRDATDLLRPVFDASEGADGFVSLEVSPHLARDTEGTTDEARRLWKAVDRPNLLIKIPGTPEGIPAVESCLAEGINVNVTLLFSLDAHRDVIEAYFRALETRRKAGRPLDTVASVASFFLSRIDTKVDALLDGMIRDGIHAEEAKAMRGKAAVTSAKLAYRMWSGLHLDERWRELRAAGARFQKPLWASTSTKNPDYSDVMYVEPLIGPHTVNTMPDETIAAFRDHGRAADTMTDDWEESRHVMESLEKIGIDMHRVTDELVEEGIQKFIQPFDKLMESLDRKRTALAGG
jgi:transaldolase